MGKGMFRGIIVAASIVMACPALGYESMPAPSGPAISVPQARALVRANPDLAACGDYRATYAQAGWPKGTGFETIRRIDSLLRQRMVFREDTSDRWTLLTGAVLAGQRSYGDCEDMAITAAHLAICSGIPVDRIGLLITDSPRPGANELHMLAYYRDAGDRVWVFGDTFGKPRALSHVRERLLFIASLHNVSAWYSLRNRGQDFSGTSATPLLRSLSLSTPRGTGATP